MAKAKKLFALLGILGLTGAATLVPRTVSAATGHQVCRDRLQFCLAGCTSSSPSDCRSNCHTDYRACEAMFDPVPPTTNPGPSF